MQRDSIQLGPLHHQPGRLTHVSHESMATDSPRRIRDSPGHHPQRFSNPGHRAPVRACRAAHGGQCHSPSRRSDLLRPVARAALPAADLVATPRPSMNLFFFLPFAAGVSSLLLAAVSLVRRRPTTAGWLFFTGMVTLGLDSIFTGLSLRAAQGGDVVAWLTPAFVAKSFVPVVWLGFTLTYSRSNYAE